MSAPHGNQFWKARATHGREKIFSTPEILWESACEYFQWCEDNPLMEVKAFHFKGEVIQKPIAKMRAMTLNGLCLFLGIGETTFATYSSHDDFRGVCELIKKTIYEQKFTGAAADLLNASIIARDLGLADKQDHQSSDRSMTPQQIVLSDEQVKQISKNLDDEF